MEDQVRWRWNYDAVKVMRVVGIDPGQTTGMCIVNWTPGKDHETVDCYALPWERRWELGLLLEPRVDVPPTVVAIENYLIYPGKALDQSTSIVPSARVIGMVEMLCYTYDFNLYLQMASEIQRVAISPRHLEKIPKVEHCRDAYKHARLWIVKQEVAYARKSLQTSK